MVEDGISDRVSRRDDDGDLDFCVYAHAWPP